MTERKIVIPGEIILEGEQYLPGEGTEKIGNQVISLIYGIVDESNNLVKIIPLSGIYNPRRGNVVIGKVTELTMNGWLISIDNPLSAFLSLSEIPRFVHKNAMEEVLRIGDVVVAKIWGVDKKGVELSLRSKGLGKIEEGIILGVNPNKVPRIIGKEGSMIKLIKDETNCEITVGQNGFVWINGKNLEEEVLAKKAINFVSENSFLSGLTEEVVEWFKKEKGAKK